MALEREDSFFSNSESRTQSDHGEGDDDTLPKTNLHRTKEATGQALANHFEDTNTEELLQSLEQMLSMQDVTNFVNGIDNLLTLKAFNTRGALNDSVQILISNRITHLQKQLEHTGDVEHHDDYNE